MNIQSSFTVYTAALHALILNSLLLAYFWFGWSWIDSIDSISANKRFSSSETSSRKPYSNSKQQEKQKHNAETTINFSRFLGGDAKRRVDANPRFTFSTRFLRIVRFLRIEPCFLTHEQRCTALQLSRCRSTLHGNVQNTGCVVAHGKLHRPRQHAPFYNMHTRPASRSP